MSSARGYKEIVLYFLQNNANIHAKRNDGNTPLHLAANNGHVEVVKLLIQHGANVETSNLKGRSPVHLAAAAGNLQVIYAILQLGWPIPIDHRLVFAACKFKQISVVQFVTSLRIDVNLRDMCNQTALHIAAKKGNADIIEYLLSRTVNLDTENTGALETPLHLSCLNGHEQATLLLLKRNRTFKINAQSKLDHSTPLHLACKGNNIRVVKLLMGYGANVMSRNKDGATSLHIACQLNHYNVAKYLLGKTRKPSNVANAKDYNGWTALHWVSYLGNVSLLQVLMQYGAVLPDPTITAPSCLWLASSQGHTRIVTMLMPLADSNHFNYEAPDGTTTMTISKIMQYDEMLTSSLKHSFLKSGWMKQKKRFLPIQ